MPHWLVLCLLVVHPHTQTHRDTRNNLLHRRGIVSAGTDTDISPFYFRFSYTPWPVADPFHLLLSSWVYITKQHYTFNSRI